MNNFALIHTSIGRLLEDYMVKKIGVILICCLVLAFFSCTENPLTSVQEKSAPQVSEKAITFIPLPNAPTGLKKELTATRWISAKYGGLLQISYSYYVPGTYRKVTVLATLRVPAGAVPYDQYLTMRLDDQTLSGSVDMNVMFGPHGTTFYRPALLSIVTTGLDLSSIPSSANVQLYYYNTDTGTYEPMTVKMAQYNLSSGMIQCLDGELPHFSRYAFGYVR